MPSTLAWCSRNVFTTKSTRVPFGSKVVSRQAYGFHAFPASTSLPRNVHSPSLTSVLIPRVRQSAIAYVSKPSLASARPPRKPYGSATCPFRPPSHACGRLRVVPCACLLLLDLTHLLHGACTSRHGAKRSERCARRRSFHVEMRLAIGHGPPVASRYRDLASRCRWSSGPSCVLLSRDEDFWGRGPPRWMWGRGQQARGKGQALCMAMANSQFHQPALLQLDTKG